MKILLVTMVCAMCIATLGSVDAHAEYKAGMRAYQAGDFARALKEFKTDKSKEAQFSLGVMHFKGQGVKADPKQSIEYFRKAAERGHANAAFLLGTIYDKGESVAKDVPVAAKWYLMAAEKGHSEAQFNVGTMYTNGEGIEKNRTEAVKWLKKAANQGHARAGKLLGVMGEDIPKAARAAIEKESRMPARQSPIHGADGQMPAGQKPAGHPK